MADPLRPFLESRGLWIVDGGSATALEAMGHDLSGSLWSARLLIEAPGAIRRMHTDFLEAGADCIVTATYQASVEGFMEHGLDAGRAADLIRSSVTLATEARDLFWERPESGEGRLRPLVAASVGPYGAFLANGSEFTGDYDLDEEGLHAFHGDRWRLLAESPADLLACETIPSRAEARALLRLFAETPGRRGWISFSCRDEEHLNDGTPLAEAASLCDPVAEVQAVGINCTSPALISPLVREARKGTAKPVVVYPNGGGVYDPIAERWRANPARPRWDDLAAEWFALGAKGIGGCCRVYPEDIAAMRRRLIR